MTYSLTLTFDIHLDLLDEAGMEAYIESMDDPQEARKRVERQREILRLMSSHPPTARTFAAYSVMRQAHDEINDYLLDLLHLPDNSPYYLFRPAISRLSIEDQEHLTDAHLEGQFVREVDLLMDGGDVRLKQASLDVRES